VNVQAVLRDPERMMPIHLTGVVVWIILTLATTAWALWIKEYLLAWVTFMSGYANVGTHLSAYQGAAPSAEQKG
jgi:hypothetical protein